MRLKTIGRSDSNAIFIDNDTVSRRHAELVISRAGEYYLTDCASTGGTYLLTDTGWEAIRQCFVHPQDTVKFGNVETTVQNLLAV